MHEVPVAQVARRDIGPEYAETFARTTRAIDSDWGCRPFVYKEVAKLVRDGKVGGLVVDIGGGEGKVARDLRELGINDPLLTFDINSGMVKKAHDEEFKHPVGIEVIKADALHIPLENDCVLLGLRILVDGHWTSNQIDQGNRELARVLRPDGVAIVAIPDPHAYIEQTTTGRHTPGVVVNNKSLIYADDQTVELTLSNTQGRSVDIPAKMHTVERYRQSFNQAGLKITHELNPDLDQTELDSYRETWGADSQPFKYRIFILKKD